MAHLAAYDTQTSLSHWRVLLGKKLRSQVGDSVVEEVNSSMSGIEEGSTWSPACYAYGVAVCLLDGHAGERTQKIVRALMDRIPQLVHRIAGKSIPMEVRWSLVYLKTTKTKSTTPRRNSLLAKHANFSPRTILSSQRSNSPTSFNVSRTRRGEYCWRRCYRGWRRRRGGLTHGEPKVRLRGAMLVRLLGRRGGMTYVWCGFWKGFVVDT